jgi:hypothetical protein
VGARKRKLARQYGHASTLNTLSTLNGALLGQSQALEV